MELILKTAVIATAICFGAGAAVAQDATPPAPPTAETASVGQVYLAETLDPWQLRCTKTQSGTDPCQIFQALLNDAGGPVAEFNMFEIPDGAGAVAGAVIVVPLETSLERGLIIKVDENEPRGYGFDFCNDYGCIVRAGFTAEELDAMKSGETAVLSIVPMATPDAPVQLTLSLKGFTAAIEKTKRDAQ